MTLYYLKTAGCGSFYIVAETADAAVNQLAQLLQDANYGITDSREVENIAILANELKFMGKRGCFSGRKQTLILPTTKPKQQ